MSVYWSDQYTCDFSPYFRMFFAVKHIYLTLYIVHALRISPIYSVPPALALVWPRVLAPLACVLPCVAVLFAACSRSPLFTSSGRSSARVAVLAALFTCSPMSCIG